ncbi:MAG TPA: riboflavin synthase [Acidimicrobiia bacterium]|jgi:riboflavin synthase|nr:riboflavin synthase [Acidimicrobiia bacterium]
MFTGIVTELGTAVAVEETGSGSRITIAAPRTRPGMKIGDSVAVNGVCLTAVALDGDTISVEAVGETLARSNLGVLVTGAVVDLERPMSGDGRFDGHIVQGHVDGVGEIISIEAEGDARRLRIVTPGSGRYLVEKGSITVDGVSLTITAVADVNDDQQWFEIVLIPHTLEVTVLGRRHAGERVNLEFDVIAKYVERLMEDRR